jgi:hypothetical protein
MVGSIGPITLLDVTEAARGGRTVGKLEACGFAMRVRSRKAHVL